MTKLTKPVDHPTLKHWVGQTCVVRHRSREVRGTILFVGTNCVGHKVVTLTEPSRGIVHVDSWKLLTIELAPPTEHI